MTANSDTLTDNHHPKGFWFIFWGELAERASFYGMRTLLLLYMIKQLGFTDSNSSTIVSFFTAACYILPIVGGYIADHYLGKFRTIIYFALPYILGHVILGLFNSPVGLFTALILLAMGSGAVKPNVSTLMGLMYQQAGKSHLMTRAFSWFYMAINIGAAVTSFALPKIRDYYGYTAAFMAPTILMALALGIFYFGKRYYPKENNREAQKVHKSPDLRHQEVQTFWRLSGLFVLIAFFWSIADQSYSTWTLFARDYMQLETPFGTMAADQIQALNPILIVLMTPLAAWVWSRTDHGVKRLPSPRKMLIGFFLVILSMALMTVAGFVGMNTKISILWEAGAYVLITGAELCISVVGLQLAFEEAPRAMQSMITGLWLCTIFVGDSLAGLFARLYTQIAPGDYFAIMTVMIVIVTFAFHFVGKRFEHRTAVS